MKDDFVPLREAALWVAIATGLSYICGSLYVSSYYSRLGIPDTELEFTVPYLMSQSLIALMIPAFWVAIVAAACRLFSTAMVRPTNASVFFPIPAVKAVAYTLSWCALHALLSAFGSPQRWFLGWTVTGTVTIILAGLAFIVTFRRASRAHSAKPPSPVSDSTIATGLVLVIALGIGALQLVTGPREWPFAPWQNWFILAGFVVLGVMAYLEIRRSRAALADAGEWKRPELQGRLLHPSSAIFLSVVAIMMLLLTVGLAGTAAGTRYNDGCQTVRTLRFDPPLPGATNETYLLLLHQAGKYYAKGNGSVDVFLEDSGHAARIGWRSPTKAC